MRWKAWLAASVSLRLARLPPLQAVCGARVAYAPRLRLYQAFSRMLWSQSNHQTVYAYLIKPHVKWPVVSEREAPARVIEMKRVHSKVSKQAVHTRALTV